MARGNYITLLGPVEPHNDLTRRRAAIDQRVRENLGLATDPTVPSSCTAVKQSGQRCTHPVKRDGLCNIHTRYSNGAAPDLYGATTA